MVLCRVSSWITGNRLVSVPFADHCEPLLADDHDFSEFMVYLQAKCDRRHWKYVEFRPLSGSQEREYGLQEYGLQASNTYWVHRLDTTSGVEQLEYGLHKNSFQRKLRRARVEKLSYDVGNSAQLIEEFYHLLLTTRRRHHLLPQPRKWFKNLVACMAEMVQIRLARKNGIPIAAMLTLRHGSTVVFKYGCSDARFHNLGGVPFLFWKLIEDCKASGVESIDLGRTDMTNHGLIAFKDRLGAARELLTYYRYTRLKTSGLPVWDSSGLQGLVSFAPDWVLSTAGRLVYRHVG